MNTVAAIHIKAGMTFKQNNCVYVAKADAEQFGTTGKQVIVRAHCPEFTLRRRSNGNKAETWGGFDTVVYLRATTKVQLR